MNFASLESHRSFLQYLIEEPGVRVWSQVNSVMDGNLDPGLLRELASEAGFALSVESNVLKCEKVQVVN